MQKISDYDIIFIDYDEPNADEHYNDLLKKFPHAKRVSGVLGSDAAHKAAAEASDTERFTTVDADNIVSEDFKDVVINEATIGTKTLSWSAANTTNGLRYGNGGLKSWHKSVVMKQRTHEAAAENTGLRYQVEFCFRNDYQQFPEVYSHIDLTGSPLQQWRAGYREGVKMMIDIEKDWFCHSPPTMAYKHPWAGHILATWMTKGYGVLYGEWAMAGARDGLVDVCSHRDNLHIIVRSFDMLTDMFNSKYRENGYTNQWLVSLTDSRSKLLKTGTMFDDGKSDEKYWYVGRDSFFANASKYWNNKDEVYKPLYDLSFSTPKVYGGEYTGDLTKSIQGNVISRVLSD